jgi:hypothetical protein
MSNTMFRCSVCTTKYKSEPDKQARLFQNQSCKQIKEKPLFVYRPETNFMAGQRKIDYFTCIGNLYSPYWASIINYYEKYSKGIMPYSAGYFELPAKFVEVMDLVHNLISENELVQKQKLERARRNYGR